MLPMPLCVALVMRFSASYVRALPVKDIKLPAASHEAPLILFVTAKLVKFIAYHQNAILENSRTYYVVTFVERDFPFELFERCFEVA